MSSLKMTFSLTSLILIFALAFVAMPAMAADGGPTPTITLYSGAEDPNAAPHATNNAPHKQERSDFRLLVTFNVLVASDLTEPEFTVSVAEGIGKAAEDTTTSGIGTITAITRGADAGKSFMVEVDLTTTASTNHTVNTYSFGYISFVVNADAVEGTQAGHSTNGVGNVRSAALDLTSQIPKNNDWTITASLGTDKPEIKDGKFTVPGSGEDANTFTVLLTRSGGTGDIPAIADLSQVQIKDKDGGAVTPVPTLATSGLVTTLTFTINNGDTPTAPPIFVGINPNWANAAPDGGLRIPAADAPGKKSVDPTVDIALVGMVDEDAETFEVKFTFEKATVDAATETAADVPAMLEASQITLQKEDPDDATMMVDSEAYVQGDIITARAGVFLATVNYRLDALPVYVGTSVDVSAINGTVLADLMDDDPRPTLKVEGTATNADPVFNADAPDTIEGMVGTAITAADVSATDADDDTLTYSWDVDEDALGLALDTATGMITGTPLKAHDMEHTVTVDDGNDGSATHMIQVTITDPGNNDPVFNADAPDTIEGMVGTAIATADVSATDEDDDTLTYSWDVDEDALGLALDTATGMITGTPLKVHDMEHTVTADDGNGGTATHMIQVTITAVADEPPFFPADASIDPIKIWAGLPFVSQVLPKASAVEGIDYLYKVREAGGDKGDPEQLPGGFELINNDVEDRTLQIREANKADSVVMSKTNYEYIAYEVDNEMNESKPVKFSIEVIAPIKPTAPTGVMAMEEGDLGSGITDPLLKAAANLVRTVNSNKVVVDWTAPVDGTMGLSPPHDEIPFGAPVTGYMVYQTYKEDGAKVTYPRPGADKIKGTDTSYTTPVLSVPGSKVGRGMYGFEVTAVNSVGEGAKSKPPADVLVADPPNQATDLRASKVPADPNSTTLDWLAPSDDGGLPNDDDISIGGYIIYQTLDGGPEIEVQIGPVVTHQVKSLEAGRHVFRIAAFNSDGLGGRSISTAFAVDVPLDPTDPPNVKPTFGNETIANITATVGTAIDSVTLPAATDPDGDDGDITYSLSPNPAAVGLSFNASTRFLSGTPTRAQRARAYTYTATDADGGTARLNFTLTVNAAPLPPRPTPTGDLNATHLNGVTTIHSGSITANGFATLGAQSLPDLEEFFEIGGTIGVSNGDATDDKNSRTVVISEILWGLDLGAPAMDQTKWQFIELYNTTGAAIPVAGWTLTFTPGNVVPASDIDQMSNRGRTGWEVDTGDTGKSGRVTGTLATDLESAITPTNIVSMYRNIDYARVKKTDHNADAAKNREEQLKGVPGGNAKGSWKSSQRRSTYNRWIYDSKRAEHFKSQPILSPSAVAGTPFRINEIGNDSGSENDWVELHNVTDAEASLKNYAMSAVTAKGTDTKLFDFKDQDWKVAAKGYVVISTRHPRDTELAAGKDISVADDQEENRGASHLFVVKSVNLPDDGKFTLILRNAHDKQGGDGHLVDVVATTQGAFADNNIATALWPLKATGAPHGNVIDGGDENFAAGKVYQRNGGNGRGEKQLAVRGFTGIGYDRAAEDTGSNGGTPGYDNAAVKEKIADLSNAEVTFSEIMLGLGDGRQNLPQWIEIYNSSMIQAVNTNGWKLHVENYTDVKTALDAVITLGNMEIPPNQTILIVTNTGRISDPDHFPSNRIVNLWTTKAHRDALEMVRRTDQVFSTMGFNLQLYDKDNKLVDEAGNLDGNRRTRDELDKTWAIPTNGDDARRSSLIRVYDAGVAIDGTMKAAWVLADETNLAYAISETYYGDPDDYGTPGFRGGGPLPVSLSKFRPERLKDTGEIVVRWITESELNNAGFNILRSEKRDGEFTKVHFVAGQGTTTERTSYEWKDTSAKPNVVYYYQIQDISLDGKVTTLRQSRLKGNVTAAGKITTTWGDIKALQ